MLLGEMRPAGQLATLAGRGLWHKSFSWSVTASLSCRTSGLEAIFPCQIRPGVIRYTRGSMFPPRSGQQNALQNARNAEAICGKLWMVES